jgi:hypothetical protein
MGHEGATHQLEFPVHGGVMLTQDQIRFAMTEDKLTPEEIQLRVAAAEKSIHPLHELRDKFDRKKDPEWKRYDLVLDAIRSYIITLHYNAIAINIRNEKTRRSSTSKS